MLVLGLTGNIGCGKSSISDLFIKENIDVIDADKISRRIFEDKKVLNQVFSTFSKEIKNEDGSLNRKKLGNIVFSDEDELIKLNNITHPAIKNMIIEDINKVKHTSKELVVIDAALLVEGKYLDIIDKLLVVTCDENVQLNRIIKRDNCDKSQALNRVNSQMDQKQKASHADYIIDNSGTLIELEEKTEEFIVYMKENWCE